MHAGALELPGGQGALLVGATGSGKSTLSLRLAIRHGAVLVTDDTCWLTDTTVRGFGSPLALRRGSDLWDDARDLWYATDEDRLMVLPADLGGAPLGDAVDASVLVFPAFQRSSNALTRRLRPAEAFAGLVQSVPSALGRDALSALASLAGQVPAVALTYADGDDAARTITEHASAPGPPGTAARFLDTDELVGAGLAPTVVGVAFGDDAVLWSRTTGGAAIVHQWDGERIGPTSPLYPELQPIGVVADDRTR